MSIHTTSSPGNEPSSALGTAAIHHVGISTLDLDRLAAFYTEILGFEEVAGFEWEPGLDDVDAALALEASSGRMAMLRLGEIHLELFEFLTPRAEAADPGRPITGVGINHLCLLVDDIDPIVRHLADRGVVMHASARDIGDGPFVYCRDPDGNAIEFWQYTHGDQEEKI